MYMYKEDLALKNLQELSHKTQLTTCSPFQSTQFWNFPLLIKNKNVNTSMEVLL